MKTRNPNKGIIIDDVNTRFLFFISFHLRGIQPVSQ